MRNEKFWWNKRAKIVETYLHLALLHFADTACLFVSDKLKICGNVAEQRHREIIFAFNLEGVIFGVSPVA